MNEIEKKISQSEKSWHQELIRIETTEQLEQLRIKYLGRQGIITELMSVLKLASIEQKKQFGPLLNAFKQIVEQTYKEKSNSLEKHKNISRNDSTLDVTAYKVGQPEGSIHLYTRIIETLQQQFISMGFEIADGPEVETEYFNFNALNIPEHHPARDMHDTFFLTTPGYLLRTHTSTVQIHAMEKQLPPIALFASGRCYRNEATDASHDFMFTQGEGLYIDKNVSLANLLAIAKTFLQAIFENDSLSIRVRPGYFPFVEPGLEIDASCPFCKHGCSVCKHTGFIELLGGGLVHPRVLSMSGINPEKYSGFAFGFGIERIAMIKYGIHDIRLFHASKLGFLDQFI